VRMKHLAGMDKFCGDDHQLRRHHRKTHESAGALIGESLRGDSERSLDGLSVVAIPLRKDASRL
jgi:hypothetical protein